METGKLSWHEAERFFAKGIMVKVAAELDLIEVAAAMAEDEIVENNDTLVLVEQVTNSVRADVAGTAGDEKGSLGHVGNTAGVSDDAN